MRIVSRIVVVLGLVGVVAAIALSGYAAWTVVVNMQVKYGVDPATITPIPWLWAGAGLGVVGGFLAGLGLAMPKGRPVPPPPPA